MRLLPFRSGSWLTVVIYPSGHHTSSLGRASLDEDNATKSRTALQDTHTDSVDGRPVLLTQSRETYLAKHHPDAGSSIRETPVNTAPGQGSQEQFDQGMDDASLISQFMNLDSWPSTDQTMTPELDSPGTPSGSSRSVPPAHALEWDLDPSSLHLVDMKKFETFNDSDGEEKVSPWPWGNYTYRPRTPQKYLDPKECMMELEFAAIMSMLREELTEAMAEEAIRDGEKAAKLRELKERETGHWAPLVVFNDQVIRGRTIYNP